MRLATWEEDDWQLRSGVESHLLHPDQFWIPEDSARKSLKVGDAAKLIFDIERKSGDGSTDMVGERIYVIVSDVVGDFYIGILDSQPLCVDPRDDFYLGFGVEVPFTHEHVIEIDRPPEEYIEWQLGQKPEKTWPR